MNKVNIFMVAFSTLMVLGILTFISVVALKPYICSELATSLVHVGCWSAIIAICILPFAFIFGDEDK